MKENKYPVDDIYSLHGIYPIHGILLARNELCKSCVIKLASRFLNTFFKASKNKKYFRWVVLENRPVILLRLKIPEKWKYITKSKSDIGSIKKILKWNHKHNYI